LVSSRINGIAFSGTMEISAKIIEMQSQGIDVYNLCVGEPDLHTPAYIKEAALNAIADNKTKYTINSGIIELRNAIKEKFFNEYNADYYSNEIIISSGAKQAVFNAIQVLINEGEEVIIPLPYYVSYPHMVKLANGFPKFVETQTQNSFKITPNDILNNITSKTKAILLCNPNNPTGAVYSKAELLAIVETAVKNNLYVISDEIYESLTYDSTKFTSVASLGKEFKEHLIIINGVSKTYCMTGWRIGYAVANKDLVSGMNKLQSHSTSNACTVSQHAALVALTGPQNEVKSKRIIFEQRRDLVKSLLMEIDGLNFIEPQGAFYFFVNIKELLYNSSVFKNSNEFCTKLLDEAHVGTVPGSVFGMEGYLRISYAKSKEQLAEAVKRIKDFVTNIS